MALGLLHKSYESDKLEAARHNDVHNGVQTINMKVSPIVPFYRIQSIISCDDYSSAWTYMYSTEIVLRLDPS